MDAIEYSNWIKRVRMDAGLTQAEFGRRILRYGRKGAWESFRRNEIGNWERGENLPQGMETFLSIALLDWENQHPGEKDTPETRTRRYRFVQERMQKVLGKRDFYCRNIQDVLFLHVSRGILSLPEAMEMTRELTAKTERSGRGFGADTQIIWQNQQTLGSKEEVESSILQFSGAFRGQRTLGERFKDCFSSRDRYPCPLKLKSAVLIYAPNYRNTYKRIFRDPNISREWLIDLCVHLRFQRREISSILTSANHLSVTNIVRKPGIEQHLRREEVLQVGSADWYLQQEKENRGGHFGAFRDWTVEDRLAACVLLAAFVSKESDTELPPVDYPLESFTHYSIGADMVRKVRTIRDGAAGGAAEDVPRQYEVISEKAERWMEYLRSAHDCSEAEGAALASYKEETPHYYQIPPEKNLDPEPDLIRLRYLCGLMYTVLTGRYYTGTLSYDDMDELEEQFSSIKDRCSSWSQIYHFFDWTLWTILSSDPLVRKGNGGYCLDYATQAYQVISMDSVMENLWDSFLRLNA